jgi:hypothetical protein
MEIDFEKLALELDGSADGPTLAEALRASRTDSLLIKVLEALARPQAPPVVHLNPSIATPKAQVIVQQAPPATIQAWTFTFDRLFDGTIKSIRATPTIKPE